MILLEWLGIFLLFLGIAYVLDKWQSYTDAKRLKPILEEANRQHRRRLVDAYLQRFKHPPEIYEDLVEPPYVPFDKVAYMASSQWRDIRLTVIKRDRYECQMCGIDGVPLEVHHITYERLGHEHYDDLVSLCRTCHQSVHDRYGYDYRSTFPIGD